MKKNSWYIAGLHFECLGCGNCCAGPAEGYIWITKPEIEFLAKHLGCTAEQLYKKYLARHSLRTTIIEDRRTKDCIFLKTTGSGRGCSIYPVRPSQCRTWPFWPCNLTTPDHWNRAATKCPGINRGILYSFEQIEKLKLQKQWRPDE